MDPRSHDEQVRERMVLLRWEHPAETNWHGFATAEHEDGECVECDALRRLAREDTENPPHRRASADAMRDRRYTVLVQETERGWFWHVAEDWANGRGWHGENESLERATMEATRRLRAVAYIREREVIATAPDTPAGTEP